jgi:UDP-N-acetylglucosamine 2-epimerase (non-hydrolysing)
MRNISVVCVVGARPNFIKMAALAEELLRRPRFRMCLVHTGQHHSPEMSQQFFEDLELPHPDVNLEVSGGTQISQLSEIMQRLEGLLIENRPDCLILVGDVTSTVASALTASKLGIPIAHVEAGLRSFDRSMPEEINRIVTDAISDYLFVTEPSGILNLKNEGVPDNRMFYTGNVMIDTLLRFRQKARQSQAIERLGVEPQQYAVVTMHRPSNVDDTERLGQFLGILRTLATELPVVFPLHPRTKKQIEAANLDLTGLILAPPQGYLDFLRLMSDAKLVLTDSGGIQEETTILQVPCLTMRENTERPITVEQGTNRLVGTNPSVILEAARSVLRNGSRRGQIPEMWDGRAGTRVIDILEQKLSD